MVQIVITRMISSRRQRRSLGGDFTIRPFKAGDEDAINAGFNAVFGQSRSIDEWRRKFLDESSSPRIMVCLDEAGDVVAHYGATVSAFRIDGRGVAAGQIVDSYAVRRTDVVTGRAFIRTAHAFFEHFCGPGRLDIIYGFPGLRALRLGRLKLGYDHTWPVNVWHGPGSSGLATNLWRNLVDRKRDLRTDDLGQADTLWARAHGLYSPGLIRDRKWIEQRRVGIGGKVYRIATHFRRDLLSAWAIFEHTAAATHIVDLLWDGESVDCLRALLEHVAGRTIDGRPSRIQLWAPTSGYLANALRHLKWTNEIEPRGCHVGIRSFNPSIEPKLISKGFHYAFGDSDLA
ncbi:MAG: hypothetical protein AB7O39_10540 [Flavobacteriaceae bacterium]